MTDKNIPESKIPNFLDCFNHLCARPAGNVFLVPFFLIVLFASFQSVPEWADFHWNVDFIFWLALVGVSGAIAGLFSAEWRLAGAISLGLCGIGAVATLNTVLSVLPRVHLIIVVIIEAVGFLPGIFVYWLVECVMGRPADAVDAVQNTTPERMPPDSNSGDNVEVP